MSSVRVRDVIGIQCGTDIEGTRLYSIIAPKLKTNENIVLDFDGVMLASSSFFNSSIGRSYREIGESIVRSQISYENLLPRLQFVLERTLGSYARKAV